MAVEWNRAAVFSDLAGETASGLETRYIEPLVDELRSVAGRFDLLAEGCRESGNPDVSGMAQSLELAARMIDDLIEEALETSLRRAVEENVWSDAQTLGEEEEFQELEDEGAR